ncbi:MAG TPA: energy transducer TonB [Sphingomonadaceae bacterium]|nr:energy transducer TonB [Sphingomonadaceae bacterium]
MDYAEDSCALRRQFGAEKPAVALEIRKFTSGGKVQITVASKDISRTGNDPRTRFLPDDEAADGGWTMVVDYGDGLTGILYTGDLTPVSVQKNSPPDYEMGSAERERREQEITGLLVERAFKQDLLLQTGSLGKPMVAMRQCLDELMSHWGVDPKTTANLKTPPVPLSGRRLVDQLSHTFPQKMVKENKQGLVRLRLMVDQEGVVSECHIQLSYHQKEYENAACEAFLGKTLFTPAQDMQGRAVPYPYITSIHYGLY